MIIRLKSFLIKKKFKIIKYMKLKRIEIANLSFEFAKGIVLI